VLAFDEETSLRSAEDEVTEDSEVAIAGSLTREKFVKMG